MPEEVVLVTEDRWMREDGGQLDSTDNEILASASLTGKFAVRVMNTRGMLQTMKKTEPAKYEQFHKEMERQEGKGLSFDDIIKLAQRADERMDEFITLVNGMTMSMAVQVRVWRVNNRMTWRRVARSAWFEVWFDQGWSPPSNQIMGMALCQRAARYFQENYREEPWN